MKGATTYLHFNGDCRRAMAFYRDCFGGALELTAYPGADGAPSTDPGAPAMHGEIDQGGQALLMASDYPPNTGGSNTGGSNTGGSNTGGSNTGGSNTGSSGQGSGFSVFIDCGSDGELDELFTALARGGQVTMPPGDMPSGRFAMCDDSFGVGWILSSAKAVR